MNLSHYIPRYSAAEQPPGTPHTLRHLVWHSYYRQRYNSWLRALSEAPLSFNYRLRFVCILKTESRNVHLPQLALCHSVTQKHDQVTTLYTQRMTPSVTMASNSSVHTCFRLCMLAILKSEVEILNSLKLP